ncbi:MULTISPECIES: hypothetical protein [Akkermansia]|jgi:hypothetical protein|uniref:hypothetical protein n=1 Tax=Akkermansia TaxID=239934 RepID=UPI001BFF8D18|nr:MULTISPECIES: hypothetical protein [Akkermansia]MBT8793939.1 hypothetical protein [Akkermansia muciniphila]MBT9564251.1 hypothetical protein [Akkermansia muciniphila]MDU7624067.1 hypothetical protein [Akkermansia sp.]QWO91023.1 hypothetical protein J5W64_01035 [Candidatus Akkermansia timonensis]
MRLQILAARITFFHESIRPFARHRHRIKRDARNMKKKRNPNIIFFSVNGLNTVVNMLMEKLADL